MNKLALLASPFILSTCTSSGVIEMGPDTYSIGTTSEFSTAYAKKSAMREAVAYCNQQGKSILPVSTQHGKHRDACGDNLATFDYTFRCPSEEDSELARPELRNKHVDVNVTHQKTAKSSNGDLYTELRKLAELRDDGVLTEEEFKEQKQKALSKY